MSDMVHILILTLLLLAVVVVHQSNTRHEPASATGLPDPTVHHLTLSPRSDYFIIAKEFRLSDGTLCVVVGDSSAKAFAPTCGWGVTQDAQAQPHGKE